MISKIERIIAFRYLKPKKKEGFLKVISIFSFTGIALGVAILIIVMSVMNGFRTELINKILGFNPHIIVKPYEKKITEGIIGEDGLFSHDWKARVYHPVSQKVYENRGGTLPRKPPSVKAKDVSEGLVYTSNKWEVTSTNAEHVQPYLDSLAYRVNYNQGSIVFSGDTRPCQSLIDLAKNADVLVMECIRLHKDMKDNITSECESSAQAAGEVANSAGVKMLVLTHQSPDLDQPFKKEQVCQNPTSNFTIKKFYRSFTKKWQRESSSVQRNFFDGISETKF